MVKNTTIQSDQAAQLSLFDEQYSTQLDQLHLYIQLGKDRMLAAYFQEANMQYVGLDHYPLETDDWFLGKSKIEKLIVQEKYSKVKKYSISIADNLFTLIPTALFDEKQLREYLLFNHSIKDPDQWRYQADFLESFDAYLVYAYPRSIDFLLRAKISNYSLYHAAYPFLEALYLNKENYSQLHLHLHNKRFDIAYLPDGKLNYFNSFNYQNDEDVLYYLLYVMEQLNLDRETIPIKVWGAIEQEDSLYNTLFKYIKKIEVGNRPTDVNFSNILSNISTQQYFNLFNQHLCA